MLIYRLGGDFKKIEVSYRIEEITGNRLDTGLVDQYALDRLLRLVNGGLRDISDLHAAEMALRGLIFHNSIETVTPSAKIQILNAENVPFHMNIAPKAADEAALRQVLDSSRFKSQMCGVDQLIGFTDQAVASSYIAQHDIRRQARCAAEEEKRRLFNIPEPTLNLDPLAVPIEYVASNEDEFFAEIFDKDPAAGKRFLRPLALSGYAAYIGHPIVSSKYEDARNYNAEQFFSVIDREWSAHYAMLRRALKIPLPLMVTLVLARATNREGIQKEILYLKDEFADARRKLWDLFDEADF